MALLFADGFDAYATKADASAGLISFNSSSNQGVDTSNGRYGGGCIWNGWNYPIECVLNYPKSNGASPGRTAIYIFFWYRHPSTASENTTEYLFVIPGCFSIRRNIDNGSIYLYDANGTFVTLVAGPFTHATWHSVAIKVTLSNTGTFDMYVDGSSIIAATGVDTLSYLGNLGLHIGYGYSGAASVGDTDAVLYDDVVVWDDTDIGDGFTSALWASPVADIRISTLFPDGAGSSTQFTPNTGANYAAVDDTAPDDDTTYVESSTSGHKDLYALGNLGYNPAAIHGVQLRAKMTRPNGGDTGLYMTIRSNAVESQSAKVGRGGGTDYQYVTALFATDPGASPNTWSGTAVDALEVGFELVP